MDNSANYNDVCLLKNILNKLETHRNNLTDSIFHSHLHLGDIESALYKFETTLHKYQLLSSNNNSYTHEIKLLQQNIISSSSFIKSQENILFSYILQDKIQTKRYNTDSILFANKVLLEEQLNNSFIEQLNSKRLIYNAISEIQSTKQTIIQSQIKIMNLQEEYSNSLEETKLQLRETYDNLNTEIKKWEEMYVLITPENGIVELANILSNSSFVNMGEPIFNLIYNQNSYHAIAVLPSNGAGEVAKGQNVNIKIDLYPYQEFGVLEGKVSSISLNSIDKNYLVYINIPNGLQSTTNKKLAFAETMYGTAEFITSKKRLLHKIFRKVSVLFTSNERNTKNTTKEIAIENKESQKQSIQF